MQALLATLLVQFVTKQKTVHALFAHLRNIYIGLWLHNNTLEVHSLADLTLVQDFLVKGFADRDNSKDNSEGENAEEDTGGEGGRKDEGGKGGRKDKKDEGGRKDKEGRKDEGGRGGQGNKKT